MAVCHGTCVCMWCSGNHHHGAGCDDGAGDRAARGDGDGDGDDEGYGGGGGGVAGQRPQVRLVRVHRGDGALRAMQERLVLQR
jgi:hypothetical protein